jgi:nitrogen-specific signal transduction histidine kinase
VEVSSHTLTFAGRDAALVLAVDVTGRRRLETQLLQSQKMEAIGLLAGGVAHDFNNLLTVIVGYAHLLRTGLRDGDPMADDAEEILRAADRAGSLTRQLVAFSRQQVLEPKVVDLNATMAEMDRLLRRVIGEDVDLVFVPGPELGHVKVDPGQIEQVIMNLAVNARDAMPRGGRLTIETAEVTLDAAYAFGRDGLKPGRYVMLAISDTGTGMSPKVAARVFEPFFTTKEQGKGTGLGLSTVHGIVKQSGGHVEVYSEPAHGTTFKVYLPRIGEVAEPLAAPEPAPPPLGSEGGGTVLLVEDEATIRGVVRRTLQARGYRVIEAAHGGDAVEICEEGEQAIDLLVTDVVMPVMSGPELVQRALSARPDLRVLFISGYTDRALVHQGRRSAGTEFLQKPFTPEELVNKVRHVLATPRRRAA